jgi:hypothetical protein
VVGRGDRQPHRADHHGRVITEVGIPTADGFPYAITSGPKAMWFTETSSNKIGAVRRGP